MKEPSSPRSYRLSSEALKALKILQTKYPEKNLTQIVSLAITQMATSSATNPVVFRVLDVRELLSLQAEAAMIERQHRTMKRDILRIRPSDKASADKIAAVAEKADAECRHLEALRNKLSREARLAQKLTPEAAMILEAIRKSTQGSLAEADDEMKPVFELELSILNSLYPQ